MITDLSLTEYLRYVQRWCGFTQREIGERYPTRSGRLHTAHDIEDKIERGERMSVATLRKLCEAMGCELEIKIKRAGGE